MTRFLRLLVLFPLGAATAFSQVPATADDIPVLVDVVPATAQYIIFAQLKPSTPAMKAEEASATGRNLSRVADQLRQLARQRRANLVVFLGSAHGIAVPIGQADHALLLRPDNAFVTAVLFHYDDSRKITDAEKRLRFTTHPPPADRDLADIGGMKKISNSIKLQYVTPGLTLTPWVYGNLSRFVQEATSHGFDTVSIHSSPDSSYETVWLPHCDEPLEVSRQHPLLEVTIYKKRTPQPGRNP